MTSTAAGIPSGSVLPDPVAPPFPEPPFAGETASGIPSGSAHAPHLSAPVSAAHHPGGSIKVALGHRAAAIEAVLDRMLAPVPGAEARLMDAMRYATLGGGKRLRGFLVTEVSSLFGVVPAASLRVAASVEMLHAYSLVHDDLPAMDDDDLRRGQPSAHIRFDEATAILAGDALQTDGVRRSWPIRPRMPDPETRIALVAALADGVRRRPAWSAGR